MLKYANNNLVRIKGIVSGVRNIIMFLQPCVLWWVWWVDGWVGVVTYFSVQVWSGANWTICH